jgi:hypothetical protein
MLESLMSDPLSMVDFILALVMLEVVGFTLFWAWKKRSLSPFTLAANLAAGACLLLAVRAALTDQTGLLTIALAGAGLAHVLDLAQRFAQARLLSAASSTTHETSGEKHERG